MCARPPPRLSRHCTDALHDTAHFTVVSLWRVRTGLQPLLSYEEWERLLESCGKYVIGTCFKNKRLSTLSTHCASLHLPHCQAGRGAVGLARESCVPRRSCCYCCCCPLLRQQRWQRRRCGGMRAGRSCSAGRRGAEHQPPHSRPVCVVTACMSMGARVAFGWFGWFG